MRASNAPDTLSPASEGSAWLLLKWSWLWLSGRMRTPLRWCQKQKPP